MSREEAFLDLVRHSAIFQHNIALILEGQAREAEKSSKWICTHHSADSFDSHEKHVDQSLGIHEEIIALLEGLTKLENSLSSCLRVVLQRDEEEKGGGFDFSNSMFAMNGDMG